MISKYVSKLWESALRSLNKKRGQHAYAETVCNHGDYGVVIAAVKADRRMYVRRAHGKRHIDFVNVIEQLGMLGIPSVERPPGQADMHK